jgi:hypothetical protein
VSYALRLAGDAISDLRMLETWLQEAVLDELDALAAEPSVLRSNAQGEAVHDFERGAADNRHVVFLRLQRDDAQRLLTVLAIAACRRPWHEA